MRSILTHSRLAATATGRVTAPRLSVPVALKSTIPLNLDHTSEHDPGRFKIQTFNKISSKGLSRFPSTTYDVSGNHAQEEVHAILLR